MFTSKDNEFIAWYPTCVRAEEAEAVWQRRRAAFYVHIPFCTAICDYCGFAVERAAEAAVPRYLAALEREIRRYAELGRLGNHRFECGHFGGGTPSVLAPADMLRILDLIRGSFEVTTDAEITVEVNPISFTPDKAIAYRDAGVNRISFGVQSFEDRLLRIIGRPHRGRDVDDTLVAIHAAGFTNFSLDVIYGIPSQTEDELRADLARAVATGATHISCFRLEIIPFTALKLREAARDIPARLTIEQLDAMDLIVSEVLGQHGYREYGAFNFAKPGFESVHNEIAFVAPQGEYVGFGNSAYSFINGHVYTNHAAVDAYEDAVEAGGDPIVLAHRLSLHEEMSRYFVLGLKFLRVSRTRFIERYGLEPELLFGPVIRELEEAGMWTRVGEEWKVSARGRQYINNMAKAFYIGDSRGRRQFAQFVPNLTPDQILRYARRAGHDVPSESSP
ncbi:radical SAM family heme chaperone HemW [Nannocystis sp.]|uniref:radical SAM family heme chaperone HemW n=1 Tax=Nannocystis sp. TaxID=1962667 RepID=UPI002424416F|nr:radical SAM family heme chaperone HemW [Nannocystis sp.]MBK7828745.1 radical SAM family heme chaperone HemW [Nannocystis sp.]MBK9753959.1 radical SAM family heme chaperone HemW [Nannocystis sp.]